MCISVDAMDLVSSIAAVLNIYFDYEPSRALRVAENLVPGLKSGKHKQ